MKNFLPLLVLFLSVSLSSNEPKLKYHTQKALPNCYLSNVYHNDRSLEKEYIDQIISVLRNNLKLSGFVDVLNQSSAMEQYLRNPSFENHISQSGFFIRPYIHKKILGLKIFNASRKKTFHLKSKTFVEDLNLDRKKIHLLSEKLFQLLFKSKGIATSKILYSVRQEKTIEDKKITFSEIWLADSDGENAIQLTEENSYCVCPQFIPNRHKPSNLFMYVSYLPGQSKLVFAPIYQAENRTLFKMPGSQHLPCISQNRDKIVFISDIAGKADLFLQKISPAAQFVGKPVQIYSFPNATQASPTFHPNGTELAFVSDKDGTPRIYHLDLDLFLPGKLPLVKLLTKKNKENTSPNWCSDGTKLVYSAKTDGIRQIWMYDFITKKEIQLTFGPKHKENPCWSPDNLHIIYNTETIDEAELYCLDLHRLKPIKITKGSGRKRFAVFEPR